VSASQSASGSRPKPVRSLCEVLTYKKVGEYHSLTVVAPEIADRARPGQFLHVSLGADKNCILRRPFSIHEVGKRGSWAATLEFVFDVVGKGTRSLAQVRPHDSLDIVGPLGRGFPLPKEAVSCLLVGGGYGVAPLLFLAEELRGRGCRTDFLVGAARAGRILKGIDAKRMASSITFVTEDGSQGEKGLACEYLEDAMSRGHTDVVYACGPMGMLAAVARICARAGVRCQVAVESLMACGVGVCGSCVIPVKDSGKDGGRGHARACVDGPVFPAETIRWDEVAGR